MLQKKFFNRYLYLVVFAVVFAAIACNGRNLETSFKDKSSEGNNVVESCRAAESSESYHEGNGDSDGITSIEKGPVFDRSFRFVVMGDTRPASIDGSQPVVFKQILEKVRDFSPQYIFIVGDIIYGGTSDITSLDSQFDGFTAAAGDLLPKVIVAPGNHDTPNINAQKMFEDRIGKLYWSFDFLSVHFILLDSEVVGQQGSISGGQLDWLRSDLDASDGCDLCFVFLHRPLYSFMHTEDDGTGQPFSSKENRDELAELFTSHGIEAVFSGHEHLFNYNYRDGVKYFITGCAGAFPYVSEEKGGFFHYLVVEISKEEVNYRLFRLDEGEINF